VPARCSTSARKRGNLLDFARYCEIASRSLSPRQTPFGELRARGRAGSECIEGFAMTLAGFSKVSNQVVTIGGSLQFHFVLRWR
jgi:hypothetical protein